MSEKPKENNGWYLIEYNDQFFDIHDDPIGREFLLYSRNRVYHVLLVEIPHPRTSLTDIKVEIVGDNIPAYTIDIASDKYWAQLLIYP